MIFMNPCSIMIELRAKALYYTGHFLDWEETIALNSGLIYGATYHLNQSDDYMDPILHHKHVAPKLSWKVNALLLAPRISIDVNAVIKALQHLLQIQKNCQDGKENPHRDLKLIRQK